MNTHKEWYIDSSTKELYITMPIILSTLGLQAYGDEA